METKEVLRRVTKMIDAAQSAYLGLEKLIENNAFSGDAREDAENAMELFRGADSLLQQVVIALKEQEEEVK